jgi:hypothetical protein
MSLSLLPLLIFEPDLPEAARAALIEASHAPVAERDAHLEAAARVLFREAQLDCDDARELVGLGQP